MVPKQSVFKGKFNIIRPLAYIFEDELKVFAKEADFHLIKNGCPTEPVSKRNYVKKLLSELEKDYRGTKENIFKALKNVKPDYLL
jgi:tRNA 2-thiocytidine biosynthesis protein TtcA